MKRIAGIAILATLLLPTVVFAEAGGIDTGGVVTSRAAEVAAVGTPSAPAVGLEFWWKTGLIVLAALALFEAGLRFERSRSTHR